MDHNERERKIAEKMDMARVKRWRKEEREIAAIAEFRAHQELERPSQVIKSTVVPVKTPPVKAPQWANVLGVKYPCTWEEVRQAYAKLVKEAHPDHGGSMESFVRIRAAYSQAVIDFRS